MNKGNREGAAGMIKTHEEWGALGRSQGEIGVTDGGRVGSKGNKGVRSEDKMTKQIYKWSPPVLFSDSLIIYRSLSLHPPTTFPHLLTASFFPNFHTPTA